MFAQTAVQKQYLQAVAKAGDGLSKAIEDDRGHEVTYAEIGVALPPNAKAHVLAAALDENIGLSIEQGAFGLGRFFARSIRAPFGVFDDQAKSDTAELLQQLLFAQEGAIAALSNETTEKCGLTHAHSTLRGFLFEVVMHRRVGMKLPGGQQDWRMRTGAIVIPSQKFFDTLAASCGETDWWLEEPCGEQNAASFSCGALIGQLKEQVNKQIEGYNATVGDTKSGPKQTLGCLEVAGGGYTPSGISESTDRA